MSNEKPVTCAEVGHCVNPDDTTDTCQRCGAVDGWIPHTGNECPVPGETIVDVLMDDETFDNYFSSPLKAKEWVWNEGGITHYRIVTPVKNHPAAGLDPAVVRSGAVDLGVKFEALEILNRKHDKPDSLLAKADKLLSDTPSEPDYETRLRDQAALAALQGLITGCFSGPNSGFTVGGNITAAFEYADAFMTDRSKRVKGGE